ncbi:SET domain-containing protein [Fragilaria crotonensis]|nr:SET domain-containing protein [Fragilaria crotonensis]
MPSCFVPGSSLYERNQYCPNCCHTWDDERYQRVHNRSYDSPFIKGGGEGRKRKNSDDDIGEELEMDPSVPVEADWYHPDTNVWGYTAGNMLGCDDCGLWVHAGCSGLSREDYDRTSSGKHPIYSKEFLCRLCCRKRCNEIVDALREDDRMLLFAIPVTEDVAPTYHDIIKKPMDLQTIAKKASEGHYWNYAWVREDFELMVLNALTFNSFHSKFWNEAKRFYHQAMDHVFDARGKGAPPGMYKCLVDECFRQAEKEKKKEEQRTQQDETTEKKDLVAGAQVTNITLPPLRSPADLSSCIPFKEVRMKPVDAHFALGWIVVSHAAAAPDTMLFCVDCGEAFHAFCVNAPSTAWIELVFLAGGVLIAKYVKYLVKSHKTSSRCFIVKCVIERSQLIYSTLLLRPLPKDCGSAGSASTAPRVETRQKREE